jgi:amino acid transporter
MTMETESTRAPVTAAAHEAWSLDWTSIVAGALVAAAASSILVTFGAAVGLGVSSASPTWRDASVALWLLSGVFLILQSLISFGCGGYLAGRVRSPSPYGSTATEETERRDGIHGVTSWALAVLIGLIVAASIGLAASRSTALTAPPSSSEPSALSYEIDHLFRSPRRLPTADLAPLRSEAGRILLTSSSHQGVSPDDRAYLAQLVAGVAGLTGADADRRVDTIVSESKRALSHARAAGIILAFSVATALLLGAVAAWAGAEAGGHHRDGMPLPEWMLRSNRFNARRISWAGRKASPTTIPPRSNTPLS